MGSINLPPNAGQFLVCDYKGFIVPEMVKKRLVIVISPRPRHNNAGIAHVIPLSTTVPNHILDHHIQIRLPQQLIGINAWKEDCWAKCDMINTVSYKRLELIRLGRDNTGRRLYSNICIDKETLITLRKAASKAFGYWLVNPIDNL
jgi:uncharacterized protein YifN (PemK superfamily)